MGFLTVQKQTMKSYDDLSMERSKSFVNALQELKNLRPQMCSAAEYCEKSYLLSDQKEMVLDNLKDYAIQALVNAIDHIGTVAYKLNDVIEQHTLDISSMDLKVTSLNQKLLTCQTYTEKEGLRQQQLLAIIPRHHKHYILPNSINKKVPISPLVQKDPTQQPIQNKPRLYPSVALAAKTLSWHLASETKSTMKGSPRGIMSVEDSKADRNISETKENKRMKSTPATRVAMQTLGITRRKSVEGSKAVSFDNVTNVREEVQNKSGNVLSYLFAKHMKLKS